MAKIRFGIIGAGQIAHHSAGQINGHPDAVVVAASDTNPERLQALAEKNSIAHTFTDSAELIARDDIDAIYVAVPNAFHAPLSKASLEAGKHVILDKPFATSYADAKEVADAAAKAGKHLVLGMNQRFTPTAQRLRAHVMAGRLGDIYHAKAYWFRRTGIPKLGTWFSKKEISGGGCLYDIGVHLLDQALYVVDNFEPVSVSGNTYTKFGNRGLGEGGWGMSDAVEQEFDVEDFATALIKFKNGLSINLDVSWAIHQADPSRMNLELFGTESGAKLEPGNEFYGYSENAGDYQITQPKNDTLEFPHQNRFTNFINGLLERERFAVSVEEALVVQRILDCIYESAETGKEITV